MTDQTDRHASLGCVHHAGGGLTHVIDTSAAPLQCCALNGDGLRDGLAWVVDTVKKTRRTRMLAEQQAAAAG